MYVRTKDQIFDLEKLKLCYTNFIWEGDKLYLIDGGLNNSLKVIKKADTIEELVDMYVVKVAENGYVLYEKCWHNKLVDIARDDYKKEATIYAHIWADDNLVKVAKMNDKGELELL